VPNTSNLNGEASQILHPEYPPLGQIIHV